MIKKKWWEKRAQSNSGWCVICVVRESGYRYDINKAFPTVTYEQNYKPCHQYNVPVGAKLTAKDLKKDEAVALCKVLNLNKEEVNHDW